MGDVGYEMILTSDTWDTMTGGYAAPEGDHRPSHCVGTVSVEELHTTEPTKALSFYEKVVGFSHRSMDMGPGGKYHILSRDGVDRGGVTGHLPAGASPHWLPYVDVDDVDATIARARKLGARIPVSPEDIPGIGRFGVLEDPTGAVLAIMKPLPRENQPW
jgi:predicted enzyme related to lactoylglutathione lyase